jgi:two-component system chemotaxis sensor kinase CheA
LTSDLQANVMKTRMQPIGTVLGKFPRIVRDLAIACGKQVNFELDGQETELDKTLLEAIRDPLTHLVRNAVDHGIELPAVRVGAGKSPAGRLRMVASHEGGKVIIEITDDGAGIQVDRVREKAIANKIVTPETAARMSRQELLQLIFLPGFSTAEKVTQFSGRGVGMDVVRTNMERIGGTVEIESTPGQGTTIRSKIPLTLAIIPALIVSSGEERYAIPQVSLLELVHLDAEQVRRSVERMHEVPVYRLRGELLPLVFLHQQLGWTSNRHDLQELSMVVLQADDRPFGLVVDAIRDTEEIVVKPLQKQLKGISLFAGAAIMGDGRVALVLDVLGLARHARVVSGARSRVLGEIQRPETPKAEEAPPALLVQTRMGEQMAVPLDQVARLEEFSAAQLEHIGERTVVQYRGSILPLIDLSMTLQDLQADGDRQLPTGSRAALAAVPTAAPDDVTVLSPDAATVPVVVYGEGSQQVGLIVDRILDIAPVPVSPVWQWSRPGTLLTTIVQERVTEVIDVPRLVGLAWQVCGQEVR